MNWKGRNVDTNIIYGLHFIVATVLGMMGISLAAQAECDDPVENVAKIGWSSRLTLSITEDDEHEWRLSIEGVAAGSTPESELQAAIQQLRQFAEFGGSQFSTHNQPNATLSDIPLLLSAASPRDATEDELTTEAFQANLARCLGPSNRANRARAGFAAS